MFDLVPAVLILLALPILAFAWMVFSGWMGWKITDPHAEPDDDDADQPR